MSLIWNPDPVFFYRRSDLDPFLIWIVVIGSGSTPSTLDEIIRIRDLILSEMVMDPVPGEYDYMDQVLDCYGSGFRGWNYWDPGLDPALGWFWIWKEKIIRIRIGSFSLLWWLGFSQQIRRHEKPFSNYFHGSLTRWFNTFARAWIKNSKSEKK